MFVKGRRATVYVLVKIFKKKKCHFLDILSPLVPIFGVKHASLQFYFNWAVGN